MARTPVHGPVVIPSCVEMRVMWLCGGKTHTNVFHGQFAGTGTIDQTLANSLMTGIKTQFGSSGWAGMVDPGATLNAVGVKDLRTANQVEHVSNVAGSPGTATGAAASAATALVVTLKTAQAGRAFRGRAYLGCLADVALAPPYDSTAAANTAAAAFVTGIMSVMSGQSMPMAIAQRALNAGQDIHGNPLPARAAAVVPVTEAVVTNPRLDSQRRRLGR